MKKTIIIFSTTLLALVMALAVSCDNWDEHYNRPAPSVVDPKLPNVAEVVKAQTGYTYVSDLLESGELDPYFERNREFTMFVFSDEQFDNIISGLSSEALQGLQNDSVFRMWVVKATLLRSAFTREEKTNPKGEFKAFDGVKVNVDFDVTPIAKVQHGSVYAYTNNIALFPKDVFTFRVEPESWTSYNMGWRSSRSNVVVPEAFGGNGGATWFRDQKYHLILNIGGIDGVKSYNVIDGVNYKIKLCVAFYTSVKCQFLTYAKDVLENEKIPIADAEYLDDSGDLFNDDINKGMRLLELGPVAFYKNERMTKFHIDFRDRTFPPIDGVEPTADQRGLIIDYIEFIPVFN